MDISEESDASVLWEDTLDLLADAGKPESFMAMLRSCVPVSLEDGVLKAETPMRLALRKISQNTEEIEAAMSQAAFEEVKLELALGGAHAPAKPHVSTMSQEELDAARTAAAQAAAPASTPAPQSRRARSRTSPGATAPTRRDARPSAGVRRIPW